MSKAEATDGQAEAWKPRRYTGRDTGPLPLSKVSLSQVNLLSGVIEWLREHHHAAKEYGQEPAEPSCPRPWFEPRPPLLRTQSLLLDGPRGAGKTSLLLTLIQELNTASVNPETYCGTPEESEEPEASEEPVPDGFAAIPLHQLSGFDDEHDRTALKRQILEASQVIRFLEPIDLDPLPNHVHAYAVLVLALEPLLRTVEASQLECNDGAKNPKPLVLNIAWRKLYRSALTSWDHELARERIKQDSEDYFAAELDSQQAWFKLADDYRKFCTRLLEAAEQQEVLPRTALIGIPVDDIDLRSERVVEFISAQRRLRHPRIVYLMTGDEPRLIRATARHYLGNERRMAKGSDPGKGAATRQYRQARELARRLLLKHFESNAVPVPTTSSAIRFLLEPGPKAPQLPEPGNTEPTVELRNWLVWQEFATLSRSLSSEGLSEAHITAWLWATGFSNEYTATPTPLDVVGHYVLNFYAPNNDNFHWRDLDNLRSLFAFSAIDIDHNSGIGMRRMGALATLGQIPGTSVDWWHKDPEQLGGTLICGPDDYVIYIAQAEQGGQFALWEVATRQFSIEIYEEDHVEDGPEPLGRNEICRWLASDPVRPPRLEGHWHPLLSPASATSVRRRVTIDRDELYLQMPTLIETQHWLDVFFLRAHAERWRNVGARSDKGTLSPAVGLMAEFLACLNMPSAWGTTQTGLPAWLGGVFIEPVSPQRPQLFRAWHTQPRRLLAALMEAAYTDHPVTDPRLGGIEDNARAQLRHGLAKRLPLMFAPEFDYGALLGDPSEILALLQSSAQPRTGAHRRPCNFIGGEKLRQARREHLKGCLSLSWLIGGRSEFADDKRLDQRVRELCTHFDEAEEEAAQPSVWQWLTNRKPAPRRRRTLMRGQQKPAS